MQHCRHQASPQSKDHCNKQIAHGYPDAHSAAPSPPTLPLLLQQYFVPVPSVLKASHNRLLLYVSSLSLSLSLVLSRVPSTPCLFTLHNHSSLMQDATNFFSFFSSEGWFSLSGNPAASFLSTLTNTHYYSKP